NPPRGFSASPSRSDNHRHDSRDRCFNPPRGFSASPSYYQQEGQRHERWFQSATRILGFPKWCNELVVLPLWARFNPQRGLSASPSARQATHTRSRLVSIRHADSRLPQALVGIVAAIIRISFNPPRGFSASPSSWRAATSTAISAFQSATR